ncbi:uncharacterized protein LOC144909178 [Branchiostoma floridae x Branchiostoma belcheri]
MFGSPFLDPSPSLGWAVRLLKRTAQSPRELPLEAIVPSQPTSDHLLRSRHTCRARTRGSQWHSAPAPTVQSPSPWDLKKLEKRSGKSGARSREQELQWHGIDRDNWFAWGLQRVLLASSSSPGIRPTMVEPARSGGSAAGGPASFPPRPRWYRNPGADVTYRGLQQDVPVRVSSDGLVVWSVETLTTTVCDADPFFFPADTMECHICFSAHTAIKQTIQCQGQEDGSNECDTFSAEKTEGEWYRKDKMFAKDNREACFVLHLERAPLFHIATTVGPCIILVALMTITFIMPLDRGDRISYGVTILLSMVVSLVFVTDVLPVKGVLPFFATVIIICMGLMGLFLFFTLIIIVIHDREGSLSPTAKIIFLRYMSKMLLLGDLTANKQTNDKEPGVINNAAIEVTNCAYEADDVQAGGEDGDGNERNEQPSTPTEDVSGSSGLSELITAVREVGALTKAVVREVGVTNAEIRELTKAVKNEEEVSDYILLAKVLDRLCLVMYVITIATTVPVSMYLAK